MSIASVSTLPTILVDAEAPTDAALLETHGGRRVLLLRPLQSFSNAVTQITHLLPGTHPDQVRALVRAHLPDAADFDPIESTWRSTATPGAPHEHQPDLAARRRWQWRRAAAHGAAWSILTLAAGAYFLTYGPAEEPFKTTEFQKFAKLGNVMCDPIDSMHARCTDVDGVVMLSSVLTGPDSTLFSFAYGAEKVAVRVFPTATAAEGWANEQGSSALHKNLKQCGRYVFYGTDAARVNMYVRVVEQDRDGVGPGSGQGLPARITGLTLGALNLPSRERIESATLSQENAVIDVLGPLVGDDAEVPKLEDCVVVATESGSATVAKPVPNPVRVPHRSVVHTAQSPLPRSTDRDLLPAS